MARIRSIKPEFWTSPAVVALSPMARLLFIGMWNFADDWGVLPDDAGRLRLQVFPGDQVDVGPLLDELLEGGRIRRAVAPNGDRVIVVSGFSAHQKIDKRTVGRWGDPDEWSNDTTLPPESTEPQPAPPNPAESLPRKGREGSGMERKREGAPERDVTVIESGTDVAALVSAKIAQHHPTRPRVPVTTDEKAAGGRLLDKLARAPDPKAALAELPDVLDWALDSHPFWTGRVTSCKALPSLWDRLAADYAGRRKPTAKQPASKAERVAKIQAESAARAARLAS